MSRKDITDFQVCEAYREMDANRGGDTVEKILERKTGEPVKVCFAAMDRACERDLVEYGVSLRTGWLTDKGKALLRSVASGTRDDNGARIVIVSKQHPENIIERVLSDSPTGEKKFLDQWKASFTTPVTSSVPPEDHDQWERA